MALTKTARVGTSDVTQLVGQGNGVGQVQMSISAEGMALIMDRLTDLYTNPIEATVRELISNGIDATVLRPEAERRPVEIALPTNLRGSFVVRDHGVGMSLETVSEIYSKYGASTKGDDMTQVGAYGLGAKAPLAYCTEFTISTTHEGITTVFNISRRPTGNYVDIISSEVTNGEAGTVVTVPAKLDDVSKFRSATTSYQKYSFDVPITVDGVQADQDPWVMVDDSFVLEAESGVTGRIWVRRDSFGEFLTSRTSYHGSNSARFLLSGWAYRNPFASWTDREPRVLLEIKPGVVDFTSSRDAITENDRSRALWDRFSPVLTSLEAEFMDKYIKAYKELNPEHATKVLSELLRAGTFDRVTGNLTLNSSRNSSDMAVFTPEQLRDKSGTSLVDVLTVSYPHDILGAMEFARDRFLQVFDPTQGVSSPLANLGRDPLRSNGVTEASNAMKALFEDGTPKGSLSELALGTSLARALVKQVYLVSVGADFDAAKLLRNRNAIADEGYSGALMVFVPEAKMNSASVKQGVTYLKSYLGAEVDTFNPDEFYEEQSARRKAARKEAAAIASASAATFGLLRLTEGIEEETKLSELTAFRAPSEHVTAQELKDANAVIVFSRNQFATVLMGYANAGGEVVNRPIYLASYGNQPKATFYKELAGYTGAIFDGEWPAKSKAASTLKDGQVYYARNLYAALRQADRQDLYRGLLSYGFSGGALKLAAKLDPKLATRPWYTHLADAPRYFHSPYSSLTLAEILTVIPREEYAEIRAVLAMLKNNASSFDELVYATYLDEGAEHVPSKEMLKTLAVTQAKVYATLLAQVKESIEQQLSTTPDEEAADDN